ncbi:MAG: hypothetical protein AB7V48_01820 [Sedimentibacter sp.]
MGFYDYNDEELKMAYNSLFEAQKNVLDNMIKEGYKTKWLHVFAIKKGLITEERNNSELTTEDLRIEWDFVDYIDYYEINPSVRCTFCNHALRHAYKIRNILTNENYVLGINHFEQFTGLSAYDVKNIVKEFKRINIEKKEILSKVIEKKDMNVKEKLDKEFVIPNDMINQLEVNLPLMDRQLQRLRRDYKLFLNNQKNANVQNIKLTNYPDSINNKNANIQNLKIANYPDIIKKYDSIEKKKENIKDIKNNNYKKTLINTEVKNNEKLIIFNEINYIDLMSALNSRKCTEIQAELLYNFLRQNKSNLDRFNIDKNELKEAVNHQLGNLKGSGLRRILVEIEFLFGW